MRPSAPRAAACPLIAILALGTVLFATGCSPKAPARTATKPPAVTTGSVTPTASVAPTATPPVTPPKTSGAWPAQVATFASKLKGQVWYPTTLPKGMKLDSVDVFEIEPGTGPVCDAYFVAGDLGIDLLQGSPNSREYDFVSIGKVPWGTETADVVYEDPEDSTSPKSIVHNAKGNLAELSGGVSFEQLKSVAAGMVLVK